MKKILLSAALLIFTAIQANANVTVSCPAASFIAAEQSKEKNKNVGQFSFAYSVEGLKHKVRGGVHNQNLLASGEPKPMAGFGDEHAYVLTCEYSTSNPNVFVSAALRLSRENFVCEGEDHDLTLSCKDKTK